MIVRPDSGRLRLILQTDHAALAAQFAAAWGGGEFAAPEPRGPVRLAAEIHDHGWQAWEVDPRIQPDSGHPYDFLGLPAGDHVELYRRGIQIAVDHHPYTGLLVSLHGTGLYKQRFGFMPELPYKEVTSEFRHTVDEYLAEQERLQADLRAILQPDESTVWTHYRWLQIWDLISLFLCMSEPSERRRLSLGSVPAAPGGQEIKMSIHGAGPGLFGVTPWPFEPDMVQVSLPVRYVTDRHYESDAAFQEAFHSAPTQAVNLTLIAGA